jgi:6-phosphogluconolactonase
MKIEVFADAAAVAQNAAAVIAADARCAIADRGRFIFAVSGGKTPWLMLRALADEDIQWNKVHLVQVDERIAPAGHPDRNLTHIKESFLSHVPIPPGQIHAMPVEAIEKRVSSPLNGDQIRDFEATARSYAQTLLQIAGSPPVLDLIHLGLGPDGHTASLVPGDPVLSITDTDVALTGEYQGRRRMTLTFPIISRARRILWVVTGAEKAGRLRQLHDGDASIPAGRVSQDQALALVDSSAAVQL